MRARPGFRRVANMALAVVLLVTLGCVLIVRGIAGATAWGISILIIGPIGALLVIASLVLLIVGAIRRKFDVQTLVTLVLSCALAFPLLTLLNIAPMAYPASLTSPQTQRSSRRRRGTTSTSGSRLATPPPTSSWRT